MLSISEFIQDKTTQSGYCAEMFHKCIVWEQVTTLDFHFMQKLVTTDNVKMILLDQFKAHLYPAFCFSQLSLGCLQGEDTAVFLSHHYFLQLVLGGMLFPKQIDFLLQFIQSPFNTTQPCQKMLGSNNTYSGMCRTI